MVEIASGFGELSRRKAFRRKHLIHVEVPRSKRIACVVREQQQHALTGTSSAVDNNSESSKREGTIGEADANSSARDKDSIVEKMFTMDAVEYITRKKPRMFVRIKPKSIDEPDFVLALFTKQSSR
ncbi:Hypothetical protein PHPALM_6284 [Phytophthora palmivora]|uniref:Uncharacterized protein n=1 Tax=Phytophthora palmivora TaxID=4796 RepID=A0A2P4YF78_9STRA|nr:Hypothetical protein PHPALM_6284 [Phytophthora palmivora]